ncbi:MAG TPA: FRG domain-containing protein [Terriglobia bacterium]|nr:FRG domain-containing protein [Terriglobia bacterium]
MAIEQLAREVKSLAGFINRVKEIKKDWAKRERSEVTPWFRGQASADWDLRPRLYRLKSSDEDELRIDFERFGIQMTKRDMHDDWDWYFLMQHYGAPTRLLDWTDSALLGLYFAVREAGTGTDRKLSPAKKSDAAVWMMEPGSLNKQVIKDDIILLKESKQAQPYLPDKLSDKTLRRPHPVAIDPSHVDIRLAVQRSHFTIHGTVLRGLERVARKRRTRFRLAKIVIASSAIEGIREDLESCGISEMTVFPDLEGLSRDLVRQWTD